MTARRNAAPAAIIPTWVELTLMVREDQSLATPDYGDGEDDADVITTSQTIEITTKAKARRNHIRYFHARRDAQPGAEVWFSNGHVWIVQESTAELATAFPDFVALHVSGAPSEVSANPELVRFFHGHAPAVSGTTPTGSRLTFANGHKLEVTESYDDLNAKFGMN